MNVKVQILKNLLDKVTKEYDKLLEEKERESNLNYYIATHDSLTALHNRMYINEHLIKYIEKALREKEDLCIAFIDLDNFKWINDNLGHKEGDNVLRKFASILKEQFRKYDLLGRIGGDEFIIISFSDCNELKQRLINLREFIEKEFASYKLSFSFGISSLKEDGKDIKDLDKLEHLLLNLADKRMYKDKLKRKANR